MELTVFENTEFGKVRIVARDNEVCFVAKDICECLEVKNVSDALSRLDEDEKGIALIDTLGGEQNISIINESGLYSLVLSSRKPEAKKFKKWVTSEVLPAIRKHGGYLTPEKVEEVLLNPDTIIKLATDLKHEREKRIQAEQKIEKDKPLVVFAEALQTSSNSILIGELAKILRQNGIKVGQNRLFEILREEGYLLRKKGEMWNMPSQRAMEMGIFEIKKTTINNADGSTRITKTSKITAKGQIYFVNKFKSKMSA